jgi:NADPH:quinone reductase-like Zn-dependent oxidoreductase
VNRRWGGVEEQTMKAVQFAEFGGPEVLQVADVEEPHPGPGQVRIKVKAVGVNPAEWKARRGMFGGPLPRIPGSDVSGVVDEVGEGVSGVSPGDEVFGFAIGRAYAEYAVMDHFVPKPAEMSWEESAGIPVTAETAVRVLDTLGVGPGDTLLIKAAAGGVGTAAVQIARGRGVEVIGTASEANQDYLRELGAIPTTYGPGLVDRVRQLAPQGVDYAFDAAGRGALPDLIEITGSADRVVTIADYGGAQEHGVRLSGSQRGRALHAFDEVVNLYRDGRFSVPIAQTFRLEDAAEASRISEEGHVRGKMILLVD